MIFHLFPTLKEFLCGRHFKSNEEVKDAVQQWLNGLAAELYDEGIQKLVACCDKCLNVGGNYVENNVRSVIMIRYICLYFFFLIFLCN